MFRVSGIFIILLAALCACTAASGADELQAFTNCTLLEKPWNDGDSFTVKMNGKEEVVRLYFVDCPETRPFKSVDELVRVEGIGKKSLDKMRYEMVVRPEAGVE